MRSTFDRVRLCTITAFALAAVHWTLSVTAVATKSPTFDEPTHFAAGYSYWLRHDFRLDSESGNLPQRWAVLPLLLESPRFPAANSPSWQAAAQGDVGTQFLYELGNDGDRMLWRGRMMMALMSAALCLVVYFWSKEIFGPIGGLISVAAATFCPTLLANGPLVTSDVTLALFFSLSAWNLWRMLQKITPLTVGVAAASVAGVILAKMSGALIALIFGLMIVIRLAWRTPLEVRLGGRRSEMDRWHQALFMLGATIAVALVATLAVWASYGFRYSALAQPGVVEHRMQQKWTRLLSPAGAITSCIDFARSHRLLPEAYLYGLTYVHRSAEFRPAFLDGNWSVIGFADFFPRTFLYKTPLPLLGLIALGILAVLLRQRGYFGPIGNRRNILYDTVPLASLLLVYGAFALSARLNIGHRHILPIYPAVFVACGCCAIFFGHRRVPFARTTVCCFLLWNAVEALATWPHYLAYFNEAVGGPANGYKHLVDSSLDWGQDLPALNRWLKDHRSASQPVYLAYFGAAKPKSYGIDVVSLPNDPRNSDARAEPLQGGLYCISATCLQQVYGRAMGPWALPYERLYQSLRNELFNGGASPANFGAAEQVSSIRAFRELRFARLCAALRHRSPVAQPGYSILVFDLSEEDLNRAVNGPPVELFSEIQVSGLP